MVEELDYDDLTGVVELDYDDLTEVQELEVGEGYFGPPRELSVIIVMVDDMGPDQLTMYDVTEGGAAANLWAVDQYHYPLQANIEAIAGEGITFDYCYATPVCSPTRAQILTGRYPHIHTGHDGTGIGEVVQEEDEGIKFLASMYPLGRIISAVNKWARHASIGKWHLTPTNISPDDANPVSEGRFEEYHGFIRNPHPNEGTDYTHFWKTNDVGAGPTTHWETTAFLMTDEFLDAEAFVQKQTTPFVLQWWHHSLHTVGNTPIDPITNSYGPPQQPKMFDEFGYIAQTQENNPPNWTTANLNWRRVHAHVESLDTLIGLLDAEVPADLRDNVLWVILGDNGSAIRTLAALDDDYFFADDGSTKQPPDVYNPLHVKGTGYDQSVRVPLIIGGGPTSAGDGPVPAAQQDTRSVQLTDVVDLFPTILDYVAPQWREYMKSIGKFAEVDGVSLRNVIQTGGRTDRHFTLSMRFEPFHATVDEMTDGVFVVTNENRWKLLLELVAGVWQAEELYYLGEGEDYDGEFSDDPLEATNLYSRVVDGDDFHPGAWAEWNQLHAWYTSNFEDVGDVPWLDLGTQEPGSDGGATVPPVGATPAPFGTLRWSRALSSELQGDAVGISNAGDETIEMYQAASSGLVTTESHEDTDADPITALFTDAAIYASGATQRLIAAGSRDADAMGAFALLPLLGSTVHRPVVKAYTSASVAPDWAWVGADMVDVAQAFAGMVSDDASELAIAYVQQGGGVRVAIWALASSVPTSLVDMAGPAGAVYDAALSGDLAVLATFDENQLVMSTAVDGTELYSEAAIPTGAGDLGTELAISSDGGVVAYGSGTKIRVYEAGVGTYSNTFDYEPGTTGIEFLHVQVSADGSRVIGLLKNTTTTLTFYEVVVVDVSGQVLELRRPIIVSDGSTPVGIECATDGNDIVVLMTGGANGDDQALWLYQYQAAAWQATRSLVDLDGPPTQARMSADGSRLVVAVPFTYAGEYGSVQLIYVSI